MSVPNNKNFQKLARMAKLQGWLCSICGGQMLVVDMFKMTKPQRANFRADEARFGMCATIDHTLPKSEFTGIDYNRRAAHRACNEAKGNQLIEPFPLYCYADFTQISRLKRGCGKSVTIEIPADIQ